MFSAFSFGKIIKSIVPGSILAAALLLVVEALCELLGKRTLLSLVAREEQFTAFTAALIPASLLLGFLLNTFVWMAVNRKLRAGADAELKGTIFPALREKLTAGVWTDIKAYFQDRGGLGSVTPPRASLEYYYLPAISLQNLNYLWESYFSWYEFQINTAYALALSVPGVVLLLGMRMWGRHREWFFLLALLIAALVGYVFGVLRRAAVGNLASYEKNLLLLIAGSLVALEKYGATPAAAGDGTGER